MSGSTVVRKGGVLLAGGGVYATAVYMTYHYMQLNKEASNLATSAADMSPVSSVTHPDGCCTSAGSCNILTNPLRTQQFQRIANIYDDRIGRDEFFMGILMMRKQLIKYHARGDVLEVGAGTGRNISYYTNNPAIQRVVLTDTSDQMLEQAREKIRIENTTANGKSRKRMIVLPSDASQLQFPNNAFDTVIDTFGLCSYDDPIQALSEMSRVCKPNGKILLLEHGRSHDWDFISKHLDKYAIQHATNWGCVWNRDLDSIIQNPKSNLHIQTLWKWHFGTTYYVVCTPVKNESNTDITTHR